MELPLKDADSHWKAITCLLIKKMNMLCFHKKHESTENCVHRLVLLVSITNGRLQIGWQHHHEVQRLAPEKRDNKNAKMLGIADTTREMTWLKVWKTGACNSSKQNIIESEWFLLLWYLEVVESELEREMHLRVQMRFIGVFYFSFWPILPSLWMMIHTVWSHFNSRAQPHSGHAFFVLFLSHWLGPRLIGSCCQDNQCQWELAKWSPIILRIEHRNSPRINRTLPHKRPEKVR